MTGRIIKSMSGEYTVQTPEETIVCKPLGVFRHKKIVPKVGDIVTIENQTIVSIEPRKNELVRPPVSNMDKVLIVTSLVEPILNLNLLDRMISQVEYLDIDIVLIFSKEDLVQKEDYLEIKSYYQSLGYPVYFTPQEAEEIKKEIKSSICVVAGQSGVGKSTLINLFDHFSLKTDAISKALGRGKHTTRHVELLSVEDGWIADTPGFGVLDLDMDIVSLSHTFKEFFTRKCRFHGCTHINEPGCQVKADVEQGKIRKSRYENYLSFVQEIKNKKPKY